MKKLLSILCAVGLLAALLTGCGSKNTGLLADAAPQNSCLSFYYFDGETVTHRVLYDTASEEEILKELNALPARAAAESALENWSLPCYGLQIYNQEGYPRNVAWSEGLWLTEEGSVYQVEADFETLWNSVEWDEERTDGPLSFPNAGYLSRYDDRFFQEYVPQEAAPEGISMEVKGYVDDIATVIIRNQSGEEFAYGEGYSLLQEREGIWYLVPPLTWWDTIAIATILAPGQEVEFSCDLSCYGSLKAGHYAICKDGMTAEFVVW